MLQVSSYLENQAAESCGASNENLPHLLYIGDVPIESSYHGSALLYRLLQKYPYERLFIIEGSLWTSSLERRLPRIRYATLRIGRNRLLYTRFSGWYSSWIMMRASNRVTQIDRLLGDFKPTAVLTVAHGFSWLTAAKLALHRELPLHLIVHDDWPGLCGLPKPFRGWLDRAFGNVYRQATSRLCVSPSMREHYTECYGARGTVLYPSRSKDCPTFLNAPSRLREKKEKLVCAYAGSVDHSYAKGLKDFARCLAVLEGRLLIFSTWTRFQAEQSGLNCQNVEFRGLLRSEDLIHTLRNEADVLFVPMTFMPLYKVDMQIGFPSKLTDYTAAGLPILIYGPEYCSAVRWAQEHSGIAELVTDESDNKLLASLQRLLNPDYRYSLGTRALKLGAQLFSHEAAWRILCDSLTQVD